MKNNKVKSLNLITQTPAQSPFFPPQLLHWPLINFKNNSTHNRHYNRVKCILLFLYLHNNLPGCMEENKISLCFSAHFSVMITCCRLFCAYAMVPSNGFIFSNCRSFISSFITSIPPAKNEINPYSLLEAVCEIAVPRINDTDLKVNV